MEEGEKLEKMDEWSEPGKQTGKGEREAYRKDREVGGQVGGMGRRVRRRGIGLGIGGRVGRQSEGREAYRRGRQGGKL